MIAKIKDIDLNADTPKCETAKELIEVIKQYHYKVHLDIDLSPEINKLVKAGMNSSQVAYSMAKRSYEMAYQEAQKATDIECKEIAFDLKRNMTDEELDTWSNIVEKHEHNYAVSHFMYLKWRSEELMVNTSFQIIEADPKIKKILAKDDKDYNRIKNEWKKYPSISKKVIDLAFKLRA